MAVRLHRSTEWVIVNNIQFHFKRIESCPQRQNQNIDWKTRAKQTMIGSEKLGLLRAEEIIDALQYWAYESSTALTSYQRNHWFCNINSCNL